MSVRFHLPPSSTIPLYPSLIVPGIPLEMVCSNQLLSGGNDEVEATDKWHQIQCRKGACKGDMRSSLHLSHLYGSTDFRRNKESQDLVLSVLKVSLAIANNIIMIK